MKLFIVLLSIAITGIFTFSEPVKKFKGTWVMQTGRDTCDPVVIRISMQEGIWQGKLDMPAQQVYDRDLAAIFVKDDSVYIKIAEDGNLIKASLVNDTTLSGALYTDGYPGTVMFIKQQEQ